jgi:hypothetical protein
MFSDIKSFNLTEQMVSIGLILIIYYAIYYLKEYIFIKYLLEINKTIHGKVVDKILNLKIYKINRKKESENVSLD